MKRGAVLGIGLLCLTGSLFVLSGAWIHVKAGLARVLLRAAWEKTLAGDDEVRPWPWADTYPVARLSVPSLNADEIVLSGAAGPTLAFGPGHVLHTGLPGGRGNCVIVGHRDTSFRFLKDLKPGDEIRLSDRRGALFVYQVMGTGVVEERETWVMAQTTGRTLTLITCYPFDAVLPGPQRYVVFAR